MKILTDELSIINGTLLPDRCKFVLEVFYQGEIYNLEGNIDKLKQCTIKEEITKEKRSWLLYELDHWDFQYYLNSK